MLNKHDHVVCSNLVVLVSYAMACITVLNGNLGIVEAYPTASLGLFTSSNKLDNKLSTDQDLAGKSFQQFINSKPGSTIIGELKPNSSDLELMLLKKKIASTILSMQEMGRSSDSHSSESGGGECFISITKVERVAGKCRKVNSGLPICQAENYMAINPDCN